MDLEDKPGCYGLPSAISVSAASCRVCPFQGGCAHEASLLLASLPDSEHIQRERLSFAITRRALASVPREGVVGTPALTVVASSRGLKRIALTAEQADFVSRFPTRIGGQVRQLMERGWFDFAKVELRAGRNPAAKGWKRVFCSALLGSKPVTRSNLRLALMEQLQLSPGSADVQTSTGIAVFAAGRLAIERQGMLMLSPN